MCVSPLQHQVAVAVAPGGKCNVHMVMQVQRICCAGRDVPLMAANNSEKVVNPLVQLTAN